MGSFLAACGPGSVTNPAALTVNGWSLSRRDFLEDLRGGADLVMGNRFQGGIEPGAMPPLHRYLGNPVLSFVGRLFFRTHVRDFHCGLRAFNRQRILDLDLHTGGMEFASEMVVRSALEGYDIRERPTTLSKDGRTRAPHLNTWSDGWRHLRFLLLYSPRWLFTIPGLALMLLGLVFGVLLEIGPVGTDGFAFDVNSLVLASAMVTIGFQSFSLGLLTKLYAVSEGFLPDDPVTARLRGWWSLEKGLVIGGVLAVLGLAGLVGSLAYWNTNSFGALDPRDSLRIVVPTATALIMSMQVVFASLFASFLLIRRRPEGRIAAAVEYDGASSG